MDPKPPAGLLMAPGPTCDAGMRLPGRETFPSLDQRLVEPEAREEMIRGRRVVAMPANPPHADRHCELDYVLRGNVKPGYVPSTELLTHAAAGSDFATDTSIRRAGTDPETGTRYLEELAFEVVNEQSARDIREKAEDLSARGVRRVIAVFVKTGKVAAWSAGGWQELDLEGTLEDPCLARPVRVRALLDAAEADDAVARALVDKRNPVIEGLKAETLARGEDQGKAAAILAVLAARGAEVGPEARARILACRDTALLDGWIVSAAVGGSIDDIGVRAPGVANDAARAG